MKRKIEYMKIMVDELNRLQELLHEYDYAVSGDSSQERFLEKAKSTYKKGGVETC